MEQKNILCIFSGLGQVVCFHLYINNRSGCDPFSIPPRPTLNQLWSELHPTPAKLVIYRGGITNSGLYVSWINWINFSRSIRIFIPSFISQMVQIGKLIKWKVTWNYAYHLGLKKIKFKTFFFLYEYHRPGNHLGQEMLGL